MSLFIIFLLVVFYFVQNTKIVSIKNRVKSLEDQSNLQSNKQLNVQSSVIQNSINSHESIQKSKINISRESNYEQKTLHQADLLNNQMFNQLQNRLLDQVDEQLDSAPETQPKAKIAENSDTAEIAWAKFLAKAGVFAILIGVGFFLKFAFDNNWITEAGRVGIGFLIGLSGLIIGYILRSKYKGYSDVIIGGGISVLYLTIYTAVSFYSLITTSEAFGLMVGVTALSVIMSLFDKSPTIAHVGIIGGFFVPILMSSNIQAIQILTYVLILDLGILAISFKKKWHSINSVAFVGTIILYFLSTGDFSESLRSVFLIFNIIYFLLFLSVSVAKHIYSKQISTITDIIFITCNSLWYGIAVYALTHTVSINLTSIYLFVGALVYAIVALISFLVNKQDKMLNGFLTGLSIVFFTAIIPLQFEGLWITYIWFTEAVILFIVDYFLRSKNLFRLGSLIYVIGLIKYTFFDLSKIVDLSNYTPVFNQRVFVLLFIVIVSAVLAFFAKRLADLFKAINDSASDKTITAVDISQAKGLSIIFFILMNIFAVYVITSEINYIYTQKLNQVYQLHLPKVVSHAGSVDIQYQKQNKIWNGYYMNEESLNNEKDTTTSIVWGIYASILLVFGFVKKSKALRVAGLIFLFITLAKVFITVWSIGGIYRIISSTTIGFLALIGSFLYVKYVHVIKDRIVES